MFRLIDCYLSLGIGFCVENPLSSRIWFTDEFVSLMSREDTFVVDLDMCSYCLRPPDHKKFEGDARVRKPTRLVTNVPQLCSLSRQCDGCHFHVEALGSCVDEAGKCVKRAKAAGVYPPPFCRKYAQAVKDFLTHEPRR